MVICHEVRPMKILCPNCKCILAEWAADCVIQRHKGRETVTVRPEPVRIKCKCGAVWTSGDEKAASGEG